MNLNRERDLRKVNFHKVNDEDRDFQRLGYFHKWVTYGGDEGVEEYALIEDLDGNMIETYTTYIKFELRGNLTYVNTSCNYNDELQKRIDMTGDTIDRLEKYIKELLGMWVIGS